MFANIFSDFDIDSLLCTQPFHLFGEIIDLFLQLEVQPVLLRVSHHFESVYPVETNLLDEVPAVADEVVSRGPVAGTTFHVAVVRFPSCRHVGARMVVPAVTLLEPLYLSAADAAEAAVGHGIPQTNVRAEHLVELLHGVSSSLCCWLPGLREEVCLIRFLLLGLAPHIPWEHISRTLYQR